MTDKPKKPVSKEALLRAYRAKAQNLLDQTGALGQDIDLETLSRELARLYLLEGWAKEVQRVVEHAHKSDPEWFAKWVEFHKKFNPISSGASGNDR